MKERVISEENPFIIRVTDLKLLHGHPFRLQGGAVIFCKNGNAKLVVDTESYPLNTDMEVILMPDVTIMLTEVSIDFEVIFFYFTRKLFLEAHWQFDPSFFQHLRMYPVYQHSVESAKLPKQFAALILSAYVDVNNRYRTIIVTNFLRNILLNIYDKIQRSIAHEQLLGNNLRKEELFHKFMELILVHCCSHRDVAFYADKLCISKRYLAAVTAEVAGEMPKQTIDIHVVQEIKILLSYSEMTLQQIADYLHFPDQSYLGRYFRHHEGQSPLAYRARNRF
ncbi:AraC family transcriptional regulator [Bacteroides sp. 214]|uniref:helix-turn-helix domain-containing protein n=1 Tax=Bacteroides sp. 214 TaxID=2302935 RepID=UPI0013D38ACD|nr:AraC family transcriptional regulator [Bacteroides sp. 214]NDW12845.1 AraC family transcriptional regulator [Bacteroides sp. 214]